MRTALILSALLLVAAQALALEMEHRILPNGLQVYAAENHNSPVFTVRIYVKAGAIYQDEYLGYGISHLVEHLLMAGTTSKRSEEHNEAVLVQMGGAHNAYTTSGHACYFIETSVDYADSAIALLADWVLNCSMEPDEVEREIGVIKREIQMGRDEPARRLSKLYNGAMFVEHPEHFPTIGYLELFSQITRDDVVRYYRRMYVPANMYVVAVGDFNASEMIERISATFSEYPYRAPYVVYLRSDPKQMGRRYVEDEMDVDLTYMTLGFRTCMVASEDTYPLQVLANILAEGRSSRLYREVKERLGLVYSVEASSYNAEYDASDFTMHATCDYDKAADAIPAMVGVLYGFKDSYVTRAELDKAKTQIASRIAFGFQSIEDQASTIGTNLVKTGNPRYHEYYLEKIKAVTREDIRRVANKYFYDDALTAAVLKPAGAGAEAKAAAAQIVAKSTVSKSRLANGMTLLHREDPNVPLVHLRAYFRGGSYLENEKNNGAFNLMARMLRRGTRTRSSKAIADEIDAMGGYLGCSATEDYVMVNVDVLSDRFAEGLDLLADVVMNSTFPEDELDKEREVVLSQIKARNDDWQDDSEARLRKMIYEGHPYGLTPIGEEESVKSLGVAELRGLYQAYCTPGNMVLAIFGDVERARAEAAAAKAVGRFKREGVKPPEPQAWAGIQKDLETVLPSDKEQAVICVGYPCMDLASEDWYAMRVLDAVTSGVGYPGGWLHNTLRGQRLVYYVHAWNSAFAGRGYFIVLAGTAAETGDTALAIIREKMDKVKREYVTDEELEMGKRVCNVMEDLYYSQTTQAQSERAAQMEVLGLGYDFRDDLKQKIDAVSREDVKRVANKYLNRSATLVIKNGGTHY